MMGYTNNYEIWHGASLGPLIMIQDGQFEGYIQNCEIWHGSSLGTFIMIQEEPT